MRAVEKSDWAGASAFARHNDRCLVAARARARAGRSRVRDASGSRAADIAQRAANCGRSLCFARSRRVWLHPPRLRFAFALAARVRDAGLAGLLLRSSPRVSSPRARSLRCRSSDIRQRHELKWKAVRRRMRTDDAASLFNRMRDGRTLRPRHRAPGVMAANGCGRTPARQVCHCGANLHGTRATSKAPHPAPAQYRRLRGRD